MCGRFAFYSPSEATAALFGASGTVDVTPRYNIAPTQDIAAVRLDEEGKRELVLFRWGLVPFWAKDPAIGNRMINARAETIAEKPSFRAAYKRRRCLVLADGFYEWHTEGGEKTPYFITSANDEPFAIAGLWESWRDKETDVSLQTATLITTAADEFMAKLHHRMPVVLDVSAAESWLAGDNELLDFAAEFCPPMKAWPVDRTVNSPRNEGEELIEPTGNVMTGQDSGLPTGR
jgi:putative SOS response-associated peptidase YedK